MNLFDYLKWRYEERQRKAKVNQANDIQEEIMELTAEIVGLEESLLWYESLSDLSSNS